jgi:hypothetical protein
MWIKKSNYEALCVRVELLDDKVSNLERDNQLLLKHLKLVVWQEPEQLSKFMLISDEEFEKRKPKLEQLFLRQQGVFTDYLRHLGGR